MNDLPAGCPNTGGPNGPGAALFGAIRFGGARFGPNGFDGASFEFDLLAICLKKPDAGAWRILAALSLGTLRETMSEVTVLSVSAAFVQSSPNLNVSIS